jgi:hypothetical protein
MPKAFTPRITLDPKEPRDVTLTMGAVFSHMKGATTQGNVVLGKYTSRS